MNQELFISEKDLEKQKMLGAGGFAAVFKDRLDNVVRVFQCQKLPFLSKMYQNLSQVENRESIKVNKKLP